MRKSNTKRLNKMLIKRKYVSDLHALIKHLWSMDAVPYLPTLIFGVCCAQIPRVIMYRRSLPLQNRPWSHVPSSPHKPPQASLSTLAQWRNLCEICFSSAEGTRFIGGYGGMIRQKIFKIWIPEMAYAAFWEHIL